MITTITALPPVPSRSDPGTFSDKADTLLGAMPTLVTELNTFVSEVNTLSFKTACKVATTTNLANLVRPVTIDGQTINVGDRVLVKDQSNTAQNGIYIAAGDNIVWARASDMDTVEEVAGSFVPITYGVTNGGKIYYTTFNATGGTLGTTAIPWNSLTEGSITGVGTLGAVNGGTGLSSYSVGDLVYASAATTLTKLAAAASGNVLKSGTAPSWGKVALASDVSGVLPTANGGTGGTLPVANGGTGSNTLTSNAVLLGNGTSAVQAVAPGTTGNILTSSGGTWVSAAPPASGVTSLNAQTGAVVNTAFGSIGSYAVLLNATTTNVATGATVPGSDLRYDWTPNVTTPVAGAAFGANRSGTIGSATALSGVWRKMSTGSTYAAITDACNNTTVYYLAALYVRVS